MAQSARYSEIQTYQRVTKAGETPALAKSSERAGVSRPSVFRDFLPAFTVDAQIGCWTRFQATNTDFNTAGFAVAKIFVLDLLQRFFDLFDQFALAVTVTQFEAELFFLSGTVDRVRKLAASSCICVTVRSTSSLS